MNSWIKSAMLLSATLAGTITFAQDTKAKPKPADKNKSEQIIIRKNGDAKEKTTIVIDGDNVTVNGKPLDEYKGDNVTVLKMKRGGDMAATAPRARVYSRGSNANGFFELPPTPPMPPSNKALLGVTTEKAEGGVKVTSVSDESGAAKAGLKEDDVITKVGDKKIEAPGDLVEAISQYKPADKVEITYKRDGKENKATATLGENKMRAYSFNFNKDFNFEMPDRPFAPNLDGSMFSWNRRPKIGMQIQDLEEGKGVKVQDVDDDSPAEKSGFKEGDVITGINGKEVAGVDELKNEIKDIKEGDSFKVEFKRDGKAQTAELKIPKKLKTADL